MSVRIFTPEIAAFIKANNYGKTAQEMAEKVNVTFSTNLTVEQIKAFRARNHLHSGLTGCFPPGHVPYNKGKKRPNYPGMQRTQFKPGNTPPNHRPVGSERVNKDGYRERKVAEPKTWRAVHVINWEAVHGPVPAGHVVIFKDRDKTNCDVANLMLVSRGELAIMNKRGLVTHTAEATEAGHTLARLIKTQHEKTKRRERNGNC